MGISNIFNIEDLTLCSNPDDVIASDGLDARLPPAPRLREEIEDVIDYQIVSTIGGGYQKYQQLNQDLYEKFHAFNSPGSSFSKPRGVDDDKWQPPLKVDHKRKGSKAQALIWHSLNDKGPSWDLIMGWL